MTSITTESWTGTNGSAWPGQWTAGLNQAGTVVSIEGNQGRMLTGTAGDFSGSARVSIRNTTNAADVVIQESFTYGSTNSTYPRIYVRSENNAINGAGGYYIEMSGVDQQWYVDGAVSFSGLGLVNSISGVSTPISFTFTAGVKYWVGFGVVGSDIKARVWQDGNAVPGWQWTTTDTTITGSKPFGMTVGRGAGQMYVDWDDFTADDVFPTVSTFVKPALIVPSAAAISRASSW